MQLCTALGLGALSWQPTTFWGRFRTYSLLRHVAFIRMHRGDLANDPNLDLNTYRQQGYSDTSGSSGEEPSNMRNAKIILGYALAGSPKVRRAVIDVQNSFENGRNVLCALRSVSSMVVLEMILTWVGFKTDRVDNYLSAKSSRRGPSTPLNFSEHSHVANEPRVFLIAHGASLSLEVLELTFPTVLIIEGAESLAMEQQLARQMYPKGREAEQDVIVYTTMDSFVEDHRVEVYQRARRGMSAVKIEDPIAQQAQLSNIGVVTQGRNGYLAELV